MAWILALGAALSVDAGTGEQTPSADAAAVHHAHDAGVAPLHRRSGRRPRVVDFGDGNSGGPDDSVEVVVPPPNKHENLIPAKYHGAPAAPGQAPTAGPKRGRGCAGCGASGGEAALGGVLMLLLLFHQRRTKNLREPD